MHPPPKVAHTVATRGIKRSRTTSSAAGRTVDTSSILSKCPRLAAKFPGLLRQGPSHERPPEL